MAKHYSAYFKRSHKDFVAKGVFDGFVGKDARLHVDPLLLKRYVSVIVKDNDYRMIIGSVKKPKLNMLMGYSKDQAINRINGILDFSKRGYTKKNRNVSVCGVMFLLTITGEGENEKFHFEASDLKGRFDLTVGDCKEIKRNLQENKS